tara:strand:- start:57 stop:437 length:381 start_codon:yes stop_codon:yes gene_type:complete
MIKFFKNLIIFQVIKNNWDILKNLIFLMVLLIFSIFFFLDWENFLEISKNTTGLFYLKVCKYLVISYLLYKGYLNLKKINLTKNVIEFSPSTDNQIKLLEEDNDLDNLKQKEKLRTRAELIKESYL